MVRDKFEPILKSHNEKLKLTSLDNLKLIQQNQILMQLLKELKSQLALKTNQIAQS